MYKFKSYTNSEEFIEESLTTPVEFGITVDTKMPDQIYYTFEINNSEYGVSIVQTTYNNVYRVDFYRIQSGKRRYWAFKTPADIRPGLSTLIKCMEAAVPYIKQKMVGIIIPMAGSTYLKKYEKFIKLAMKKTYLKTYTHVPVSVKSDAKIGKNSNYLFIIRKGIPPENVFKSPVFKKNYEFGVIDSDFLEDIEFKRVQKTMVSTKLDPKYAFKTAEIEFQDSEQVIDIITKAKVKDTVDLQKASKEAKAKKKKEYDALKGKGDKDLEVLKNGKLNPLHPFSAAFVAQFYDFFDVLFYKDKVSNAFENKTFEHYENWLGKSFYHLGLVNTKGGFTISRDEATLISNDLRQWIESEVNKNENANKSPNEFRRELIHAWNSNLRAYYNDIAMTVDNITIVDKGDDKNNANEMNIHISQDPKELDKFLNSDNEIMAAHAASAIIFLHQDLFKILKEKGFDASNYNHGNFKYALKTRFQMLNNHIKKFLIKGGLFDASGEWLLGEITTRQLLKLISDKANNVANLDYSVNSLKDMYLVVGSGLSDDWLSSEPVEKKIELTGPEDSDNDYYSIKEYSSVELPFPLMSKVKGFEKAGVYDEAGMKAGFSAFRDLDEDLSQKIDSINEMPQVAAWLKGLEAKKPNGFTKLRNYTGSYYSEYNTSMRDFASGAANKISDDALKLLKYFYDAPELEDSIFVYRNGYVPDADENLKAGKIFVEAGFMSTTIKSDMTMGSDHTRMLIYLPKGSKVYPILDHSQHPGEKEVVLPPMSAFKIIDHWKATEKHVVRAVYVGTAMKAIEQMIKDGKEFEYGNNGHIIEQYLLAARKRLGKMDEAKTPKKWHEPIGSLSKELRKLIDNKKLRLDLKPKQNKDKKKK